MINLHAEIVEWRRFARVIAWVNPSKDVDAEEHVTESENERTCPSVEPGTPVQQLRPRYVKCLRQLGERREPSGFTAALLQLLHEIDRDASSFGKLLLGHAALCPKSSDSFTKRRQRHIATVRPTTRHRTNA